MITNLGSAQWFKRLSTGCYIIRAIVYVFLFVVINFTKSCREFFSPAFLSIHVFNILPKTRSQKVGHHCSKPVITKLHWDYSSNHNDADAYWQDLIPRLQCKGKNKMKSNVYRPLPPYQGKGDIYSSVSTHVCILICAQNVNIHRNWL